MLHRIAVGLLSATLVLSGPVARATPAEEALTALASGNARFAAGKPAHPHAGMDRVADTGANGQTPSATVLACSDSRLPVERVFDQGVGDVFVVRVAGNVAGTDEVGSVEYGAGHLKTPLVVVMGHTKCGAVTAAATGVEVHGSIPALVDNIIPAVERAKEKHPAVTGKDLVPFAIDENVLRSMADLLGRSEALRGLVGAGRTKLVGAVYDVDTGAVRWLGEHPEQASLLASPSAGASGGAERGGGAKAVGGQAAEASRVASTGAFAAPDLRTAARPAYGAKAATGAELTLPAEVKTDGAWAFWLFAGGAGLVLAGTGAAVVALSRTRDRNGNAARAMTLGAKLAGGFGTLAAMTLGVSAIAVRSSGEIQECMARIQDSATDAQIIAAMQADLLAARMSVKGFLLTNADEDLARFSSAAAGFDRKAAQARAAIPDPKHASEVASMTTDFDAYGRAFAEVVGRIDERNGVVETQMGPAAARATELIAEIARTAHEDGDDEVGFLAEETNAHYQEARVSFFKFLRKPDPKLAEAAVRLAEDTKESLAGLAKRVRNPRRRAWMAEATQAISFWCGRMERAEKVQEERNALVKDGLDRLGPKIAGTGDGLLKDFARTQAEVSARATAAAASARFQVIALGSAVAVFAMVTAFLIARGVIGSLGRLEASLKDIAQGEGDLTVQLEDARRDELGRVATFFNQFVAKIRTVVAETASVSSQVAAAATEVAASAEEMSASVSEVAQQCSRASDNATASGRLATEGGKVVEQTVAGIKEIDAAVSASAQSVTALGERGEQIGRVIDVIREIADQTNLLALNAAIEAARAGEHGRGFAVVADQVRTLAERTTKATEEITGNIGAIQEGTAQAVERMSRGTEQVRVGVASAAKASENLTQIVEGATSVAGMIQTIAAAAEEAGAGATQAAGAASELSNKAEQLKALMSGFKV